MKVTKTSMIGLAMAVGLLVSLIAPAAMAEQQAQVGVIRNGTAKVNQTLACTKAGGVDPTGSSGLTYPQLKDVNKSGAPGQANKDRAYRFEGTVDTVEDGAGVADICGYLTKVGGIGPRCGMSKGYNGKGLVTFAARTLKVDQLTWKLSGAFFLVTANVWDVNENGGKEKAARLYGIVVALPVDNAATGGPESCTNGYNPGNTDRNKKVHGAQLFTINAVLAIWQGTSWPKWNDITDPIDGKDEGKSTPTNPWGDKKNEKPKKTA